MFNEMSPCHSAPPYGQSKGAPASEGKYYVRIEIGRLVYLALSWRRLP